MPHTQFLSNGNYVDGVTNAGGGAASATHDGDAVAARCRPPILAASTSTCATFAAARSGRRPTCRRGASPTTTCATFQPDVATFDRRDDDISTRLEIAVSTEHDVEVRRLSSSTTAIACARSTSPATPRSRWRSPADDFAHPAFGKLFIETEYLAERSALICHRRPRDSRDPEGRGRCTSSASRAAARRARVGDRSRAIHRPRAHPDRPSRLDGRRCRAPRASFSIRSFSLRQRVRLPPGESVRVCFATGIATDRETARALALTYRDPARRRAPWPSRSATRRACGGTWVSRTRTPLLFERLASRVLADGSLRAARRRAWRERTGPDASVGARHLRRPADPARERRDERRPRGSSGKRSQAQEYWRLQGARADLVILNEHPVSYLDEVQRALTALLDDGPWRTWQAPAGRRVPAARRPDGRERAHVALLRSPMPCSTATAATCARSWTGRPTPQSPPTPCRRSPHAEPTSRRAGSRAPTSPSAAGVCPTASAASPTTGGRTSIVLEGDQDTPVPWVNVIANPRFGTIVTASAARPHLVGEQPRESADAVRQRSGHRPDGEALFVRDDESGDAWSPTPGPMPRMPRAAALRRPPCSRRHARSRAVARHPPPARRLRRSRRPGEAVAAHADQHGTSARTLSVFGYNDWVLGPPRERQPQHVVTEATTRGRHGARPNPFNDRLRARVAFAPCSERPRSATGDRRSFLGRNGSMARPAALSAIDSSDPRIRRRPRSVRGPAGRRRAAAGRARGSSCSCWVKAQIASATSRALMRRHATRRPRRRQRWRACTSLGRDARRHPGEDAGRFVRHPDEPLAALPVPDAAASGRAPATTSRAAPLASAISCRTSWRCSHAGPSLARAHILRAAGRQFVEGDVQHWWHEPVGRGLRSRCSDDLLWLPYVVAQYVRVTGDTALLDEQVPFLDAPALAPDAARDLRPAAGLRVRTGRSSSTASAPSTRASRPAPHGLPLIGTGDWNDGMNRVGHGGPRREHLARLLPPRRPHRLRADLRDARRCAARRALSRARRGGWPIALEQAWDGEWYRRGYYDDGTPLGSVQNDECSIDSIAQSWAMLSGAVPTRFAERAMDAVRAQLVERGIADRCCC